MTAVPPTVPPTGSTAATSSVDPKDKYTNKPLGKLYPEVVTHILTANAQAITLQELFELNTKAKTAEDLKLSLADLTSIVKAFQSPVGGFFPAGTASKFTEKVKKLNIEQIYKILSGKLQADELDLEATDLTSINDVFHLSGAGNSGTTVNRRDPGGASGCCCCCSCEGCSGPRH